eukprot:c12782_g4_i1.p1 GENE.c12782_g4_i1~~c12782_g4_i1.p1  ORF type:complete len:268 (+),score=46.27 c12782_g4_i1:46-849(+)
MWAKPQTPQTQGQTTTTEPENANTECYAREGYMVKRGGRVKTWKRRWFVLQNNELIYYKTPRDTAILGTIPIDGEWITEMISHGKHPYAFRLMSRKAAARKRPVVQVSREADDERVFICSCESEADRREWLRCINATIRQLYLKGHHGRPQSSGGRSKKDKRGPRRIPSSPQIVIQPPSEISSDDHAANMADLDSGDFDLDDDDDDGQDNGDDDKGDDKDDAGIQATSVDDSSASFWNESESDSDPDKGNSETIHPEHHSQTRIPLC